MGFFRFVYLLWNLDLKKLFGEERGINLFVERG
jgi:hypothetical protein